MAAGLSLWGLLQFNPVSDAWRRVKLILLLVCIVLGSYGAEARQHPSSSDAVFCTGTGLRLDDGVDCAGAPSAGLAGKLR